MKPMLILQIKPVKHIILFCYDESQAGHYYIIWLKLFIDKHLSRRPIVRLFDGLTDQLENRIENRAM